MFKKLVMAFTGLVFLCGAQLHRVIVYDGANLFPCDGNVHTVTISAANATQITHCYEYGATNAEWYDLWISDANGDILCDQHPMRFPVPVVTDAPEYSWWGPPENFRSFEPDYFNSGGQLTLNARCDAVSGTEMVGYGVVWSR